MGRGEKREKVGNLNFPPNFFALFLYFLWIFTLFPYLIAIRRYLVLHSSVWYYISMVEKDNDIINIKQQMRKGILSYVVLLSIKNHKEAYASTIIKDLKSSDLIIVEGTVYPLLNRLKREEILTYKWKESKSGPPRKYYKLTKKGFAILKILQKTWNELEKTINNLTIK